MQKLFHVSKEQSGQTLLTFLKEQLGAAFSLRKLKAALDANHCELNGRPERFGATRLKAGDRISFRIPQALSRDAKFSPDRILYEDDYLLAYNKPAGVSCDSQGMEKLVKSYASTAELIHRLDRDTTGVLLFAKATSFKQRMITLFRQQELKKGYLAIVDGIPSQAEGVIENYLGKVKLLPGQAVWGAVKKEVGLFASTHWVLKKAGTQASLVACFPKTGRTHQLRVHLSEWGHPILGDFQYAKAFKCPYRPERFLLHAASLEFEHPISHQHIQLDAPLPEDFLEALSALHLA